MLLGQEINRNCWEGMFDLIIDVMNARMTGNIAE